MAIDKLYKGESCIIISQNNIRGHPCLERLITHFHEHRTIVFRHTIYVISKNVRDTEVVTSERGLKIARYLIKPGRPGMPKLRSHLSFIRMRIP